MPSSLIFVGLVVLWLLILVPTVARRRQEVAHPSRAALSGRVLHRTVHSRPTRRPTQEVDVVPEVDEAGPVPVDASGGPDAPADEEPRADVGGRSGDEPDEAGAGDARWERPEPRYRPGRGGFDPAAAALAAQARYAFRRRVVCTMLVAAAVTAAVAVTVLPALWWPHTAVDVVLVGYLIYLRRQVRMEEAIRERRAARMAGTRRPAAAEDPQLDEWARRGRTAVAGTRAEAAGRPSGSAVVDDGGSSGDSTAAWGEPVTGDGVAPDPDERAVPQVEEEAAEPEPALPRLQPVAPPSLPSGTALLGDDDLAPDLPAVDLNARRDYRRAVGQ